MSICLLLRKCSTYTLKYCIIRSVADAFSFCFIFSAANLQEHRSQMCSEDFLASKTICDILS